MQNAIPTPQDEGMRLTEAVTKTASYNTDAFDQGSGFAPGGLGMAAAAVINVTAIDLADEDETYKFKLQESDDGDTWDDCGVEVSATATGVIAAKGFLTKRYVRLALTAGGTTPSIKYEAWLNTIIQR